MKKALIGMSGGVDSSVAAYLLKQQGYDVLGVSFILYEARMKSVFAGCCSIEVIRDAARTAAQVGIRHVSVDLRDEFMNMVIEPFLAFYSNGLTPNPCIWCNKYIKFPHMLKIARENGCDVISTGHYAQIAPGDCDTSDVFLKKGVDVKKDQSYFLYVLRPDELSCLVLPLGGMGKPDVRFLAGQLGLPAAKRPESQEICFIEDKKYFRLLDKIPGIKTGRLINIKTGRVLGEHKGIHLFTVGQRKRLGIATREPLYVAKIDPSDGSVYVGDRDDAMVKEFDVEDINWLKKPYELTSDVSAQTGGQDIHASVKIRSTMQEQPAVIHIKSKETAHVIYDKPQWAPAAGQSAVFYEGDVVIGGGIITTKA